MKYGKEHTLMAIDMKKFYNYLIWNLVEVALNLQYKWVRWIRARVTVLHLDSY